MNKKKDTKLRNYSILILLSAITVAITFIATLNSSQEESRLISSPEIDSPEIDSSEIDSRKIDSRKIDNHENKSIKDLAHHVTDLLPKAQGKTSNSHKKIKAKIKNAIIGTTREFKTGGKNPVKGKVLDFYELPSKGSIRSRITLIDIEKMKYPKLRVEETYENNGLGQETILDTKIMVADHVIVKVKPHITSSELSRIASSHGLKIRKKMYSKNTYLLETPEANIDSAPNALASLKDEQGLKIIDPDYTIYILGTPNDQYFSPFKEIRSQEGQRGMLQIDAPEAWDLFTGSRSVIVAIIDSGIDYDHPDLAANIWTNPDEIAGNGIDDDGNGLIDDVHGYDFLEDSGNPDDPQSHGTHNAGVIGAVGNNLIGVAGINWQVTMMALKTFDSAGDGYASDAAECINYATDKGVDITSNSWGSSGISATLKEAIERANDNNILFVAAAGNINRNNDVTPHYPASYDIPNIISVAATGGNGKIHPDTNYGRNSVDLAAPGHHILSTIPVTPSIYSNFFHRYYYKSGSSTAAPHVSGVCALLKGYDSTLTAKEIKFIVLNSGEHIPSAAQKLVSGRRLNAFNALNALNLIADGILTINRPFNEQRYHRGQTVTMNWESLNVDGNVKIQLFKDGVLNTLIADDTDNDGEFDWVIPEDFTLADYVLKITAKNDSSINAQNNITVFVESFPKQPFTGWIKSPGAQYSWSIDDEVGHATEGHLTLKDDNPFDSGDAAIEYSGNFRAGQVSFDQKTDFDPENSDTSYEHLVFYIDDVEQSRWTGKHGWSKETYNVPAGIHTFKWQYRKFHAIFNPLYYTHTAWIDDEPRGKFSS